MKRLISLFALVLLVSALAFSAGTKKTVPVNAGYPNTNVLFSFGNSYVDTVVIDREAGLEGLALAINFLDTAAVTNVIVRRVINGVPMPVIAGDTLTPYTSLTTTAASQSCTATITLTPLADQYWCIVKMAASGAGVAGTHTYLAEALRQYGK